jgi:hypothetical protein
MLELMLSMIRNDQNKTSSWIIEVLKGPIRKLKTTKAENNRKTKDNSKDSVDSQVSEYAPGLETGL